MLPIDRQLDVTVPICIVLAGTKASIRSRMYQGARALCWGTA
jgi:hypothetical protein